MSQLSFLFMLCGYICESGDLLLLIVFEIVSIRELWQLEDKEKGK